MPPEMRVRGAEVRNGRRTVPRIALGLFIALMVVLIGRQIIVQVFHDTSPIVAPINDARAPDSTILATSSNANPLSMSVMETTSTTIPPQTLTPSLIPSPTSTPRRPLLVDVPLGLRNQFLIHKVFEGESLELLANKHHTTVEAIRAVNYYLPSPVWVDFVVVIPLKPDDIQNMPPFEPYMVVGENITIHDLAQKLAVDVSALAYYNALDEGYVLVPGDWLLIPRTRPTP